MMNNQHNLHSLGRALINKPFYILEIHKIYLGYITSTAVHPIKSNNGYFLFFLEGGSVDILDIALPLTFNFAD